MIIFVSIFLSLILVRWQKVDIFMGGDTYSHASWHISNTRTRSHIIHVEHNSCTPILVWKTNLVSTNIYVIVINKSDSEDIASKSKAFFCQNPIKTIFFSMDYFVLWNWLVEWDNFIYFQSSWVSGERYIM